ncbi:hypothetical protein ACJIZ3_022855 [Penstemon smallii]|uniref:Uncharacterized protein n=1 Tax=Penstemon smallii TaxID=265156 RepID=A0ABD3TMI7_9LAMI
MHIFRHVKFRHKFPTIAAYNTPFTTCPFPVATKVFTHCRQRSPLFSTTKPTLTTQGLDLGPAGLSHHHHHENPHFHHHE